MCFGAYPGQPRAQDCRCRLAVVAEGALQPVADASEEMYLMVCLIKFTLLLVSVSLADTEQGWVGLVLVWQSLGMAGSAWTILGSV